MSPHLVRYNERITINNIEITDNEISYILEKIAVKVEEYNNTHKIPVKEFEVVTTLALIYFAESNCDFVVLETGMGGIDDCTNIAEGMISIITEIGLDHMAILGDTIEEIAQKKAGIIKENNDTIMCFKEKVTDIIEKTCKEKNNKLHLIQKGEVKNYSFDEEYQKIDYREYKNIFINLKGKCQIYNAAIAMECVNILNEKGYQVNKDAVKKGLKTVVHKARFEILLDNPKIIFDGGHNEDAIDNLKNTINQYYKQEKKVYILSLLKTKDYKTVIKKITEDKEGIFIFTEGNNDETFVSKDELYNEAKKYLDKNIYKEELKDALKIATNKYKKEIVMVIRKFLCI